MQNARPVATVERERERESRSLTAIAVLACVNGKISLQTSRLHITYKAKIKDIKLMHRKTVC